MQRQLNQAARGDIHVPRNLNITIYAGLISIDLSASRLPDNPPQRHILTSSVLGCSSGILAFPDVGSFVLNVIEETDKRRGHCAEESTWPAFFMKLVVAGKGRVSKTNLTLPRLVLPDAVCMLQNHDENDCSKRPYQGTR